MNFLTLNETLTLRDTATFDDDILNIDKNSEIPNDVYQSCFTVKRPTERFNEGFTKKIAKTRKYAGELKVSFNHKKDTKTDDLEIHDIKSSKFAKRKSKLKNPKSMVNDVENKYKYIL